MEGLTLMDDLLFMAITAAFAVLCIVYVSACERL